eukprot:m.68640 g.68640  ORF g.68640 m.68640 type:complete len:1244 (-) comp8528_c0_seq1:119-3850(-)
MSRLRQSPKHLFESFVIFEVEATGTGFENPKIVFEYPDGGRRSSYNPDVDFHAVAQFCLPYAPQKAETGSDLPWALLKYQAFTFSLTDEHSFLAFAVCIQSEATGVQRKSTRHEKKRSILSGASTPLLESSSDTARMESDATDASGTGPAVRIPSKQASDSSVSPEVQDVEPPKKRIACIVSHYPWRDFFYGVVNDIMEMSDARRLVFLQKLSERDSNFRFHQMSGKKVRVALDKKTDGGAQEFLYKIPNDVDLPAAQSPDTEQICNLLGANLMVKAFCAMLMERRIIVVSETVGTVTRCIYTLNALMYPMSWQHTFIPVMPYHVKEVVCAMMPYVVGIHSSLRPDVVELLDDDDEGYVIIDCDKHVVESPFHDEKRVNRAWLRVLTSAASTKPTRTALEASKAIAKGFAALFVETFGHVDKHIETCDDGLRLNHEAFVKGVSGKMQPLLIDLMETQGFLQFVQSRCDQKVGGKSETARSDLFGQLVARQTAELDSAPHNPTTESRGRISTFARIFNKGRPSAGGNKEAKEKKKFSSGLGLDRFRQSSQQKTAVALQKARESTSAGAVEDARTYAEFMQTVIADMEVTMRSLEAELASQTAKHSSVAMQYADLKSRYDRLTRRMSTYSTDAVSPDGIKTHGVLHEIEDTLAEIHELRQSLVSITQQQVKINGSALSGVANLKAFWAVSQLDPDHADGQAEEYTSDKVVSQLSWLMDEARHVGESHDLALDRIALCVADTKRLMTKVENNFAPEAADGDGGSDAGWGTTTLPFRDRRYSETSADTVFHILVCTGECHGPWPELTAVLTGTVGCTGNLPLTKSLKGGQLRLESKNVFGDDDEGDSDGDAALADGESAPRTSTSATEDIYEVHANYIGHLKTIDITATIPSGSDTKSFEWRLQMIQVNAGGGATWTFPCAQLFSTATGLCHTFTSFGTGERLASTRRRTRGISLHSSGGRGSGATGGGSNVGGGGGDEDTTVVETDVHQSLLRAASLRPGQFDPPAAAAGAKSATLKMDWMTEMPTSYRTLRRQLHLDSMDSSAETDALLQDLHRTTDALEQTRSPTRASSSRGGAHPNDESMRSDDSLIMITDDLGIGPGAGAAAARPADSGAQATSFSECLSDITDEEEEDMHAPVRIGEDTAAGSAARASNRLQFVLERPDATASFGCNIGSGVDGHTYAINVSPDSSAAVCGLEDRDRILTVDKTPVDGLSHDEVLQLFAHKTAVRLEVERMGGFMVPLVSD